MSAREAKSIRTRGEIEAAVRVFTSAQWARLHYVAKIHAWRTGWTFEELLQEAILRTLAGDRNCPSDVGIIKHLADSVSSIADGERKKAPNQSPHVPVVGPGEPAAGAENPATPEISREESLVVEANQEEIRQEVLAIFDDDLVARDIVEGIMANYSADDLKELSGLQGKDTTSAISRSCDAEANESDLRGTAVTMLSEAGNTIQQVASVTGHSLKTVTSILEKYLARTRGLSDAAITNFENSPRTNFANQLQTKPPKGKNKNRKVDGLQ